MQNLDHMMMDEDGNITDTINLEHAQLRKEGAIGCMVEFLNFLMDLKTEGIESLEMNEILVIGAGFLSGIEEIDVKSL